MVEDGVNGLLVDVGDTAGLTAAIGDRTLGVMPLYHTMGIHSLLAMHLVGVGGLATDVAFLCLPDDAAKEAVSLVTNPDTVCTLPLRCVRPRTWL